ncbi:hypothetical protein [Corynebacterium anserum]|uniref:Uncharacterized protein n=1 Tax=Corynebacterium anserum TaxID=2684406 RepID=A0A7G7YM22_9CORY|nr:hypothetical protein [Corynebacterium anserum]MBC2681280.1 hypothetical protein [Corynebacterium anserum]QNH95542.1 hypothetical protein GP473_01470 [Corynebacterium anserum]
MSKWLRDGDVVLTRRNDYELVTATGEPVRNGQRWVLLVKSWSRLSSGSSRSISMSRCRGQKDAIEQQDRIKSGYHGLSDPEREQAAPVFAELEGAGVWIDFAERRQGRVSSPLPHHRRPMCTRVLRMDSPLVLVSSRTG